MHADKHMARAKRRNWLAIQSHIRKHTSENKMEDEKEKVCIYINNGSFQGQDRHCQRELRY